MRDKRKCDTCTSNWRKYNIYERDKKISHFHYEAEVGIKYQELKSVVNMV